MCNVKQIFQRTTFKNAMALWLVQVANYLIPIAVIPYVTRILGVERFGDVCYAQNIVAYLAILVNFGFDYSATQDIANHRGDKQAIQVIYTMVMSCKVLLFVLSLFFMMILYFILSPVQADPVLYFWACLFNLSLVLLPSWYFQGQEQMQKLSLLNFLSKFLGAVAVFCFVKSSNHASLYLAILAVSSIAIGLVSMRWTPVFSIRALIGSNLGCKVLCKSVPVFITNLANSLYNLAGLTIIGLMLTAYDVGIYAGSQKIIQACIMLTVMPFTIALFPKVSRLFNENPDLGWGLFRKIMMVAVCAGILMIVAIYVFAPIMVRLLLGEDFVGSVEQVRLMAGIPALVLWCTMITVQGLYGLQLQRFAPWIAILSGLISVVINITLIPVLCAKGSILAWYVAQFVELILAGLLVWRYSLKKVY
jgi:PST family polysaccharide transporter